MSEPRKDKRVRLRADTERKLNIICSRRRWSDTEAVAAAIDREYAALRAEARRTPASSEKDLVTHPT